MLARVFLDWSRPLLPAVAEWLLRGAPCRPAPDLSDTVVVLPTAAAGRRLREILAWESGETGLLSPYIFTPEVLLVRAMTDRTEAAGRGEQTAAWAAELKSLSLDQWRDLFPVDPVNQDLAWAIGAAGDLLKLRRQLEEGGRGLGDAARDLGPAHPEAARWQALARLEKQALTRLRDAGFEDPLMLRVAAASAPVLPEGVTRVVVAGVPDSIRLVRTALDALPAATGAAVTLLIHAPASLDHTFDPWGRPEPEIWTSREIPLPRGHDTVTLTDRPQDAARVLVEALTDASPDTAPPAIGSADPEVSAPLRRLAAAENLAVFDPEGQPLAEHEVSWLLHCLTRLLRSDSWAAASRFLRLPDVLTAASRAVGGSRIRILEDWDAFQQERLPQQFAQARPLADHWVHAREERQAARAIAPEDLRPSPLPAVLTWLSGQLRQLARLPLADTLAGFLESLFENRTLPSAADGKRFTDALTAWLDVLGSVERGAAAFLPELPAADRLELAASHVREIRLYTPHPDTAHALHGWLELSWQDTPDLVIAGLNEGLVPDSIQGDPWLPDSVRDRLELKTNATRLARDSYLLSAMIASRQETGSLRLITGRSSAAGDPLKPSRLLLRCPPEELPERALHLFPKQSSGGPDHAPAPVWRRAWSLAVPGPREDASVFHHLSVTAFADYLKCPFRFYLRHVLRMEPFDAAAAELDPRAVGNHFHNTMEDLHRESGLRDSPDAAALTRFLHEALDLRIRETYGSSLTIPVGMQVEVIRNCLAKAAEIHAAESEKGWRFQEVEIAFPTLIRIRGTEIRGRIDLIQKHPDHGYRILDYKTASTGLPPAAAHLKPVSTKAAEALRQGNPDRLFTLMETGGKLHRWQNLQLPLYARIMAGHYDVDRVTVGYINLPRAVSEAGLFLWDGLDGSLLDSAWACAESVIERVQRGVFWPPEISPPYDDFASLTFQDMESSFDSSHLQRVAAMIASGSFQPVVSTPS